MSLSHRTSCPKGRANGTFPVPQTETPGNQMIIQVNTYKLGVRDERERVRKLLQACLAGAIADVPDEDTEVEDREELQTRSNAVQDTLEVILAVLDNWKPNK